MLGWWLLLGGGGSCDGKGRYLASETAVLFPVLGAKKGLHFIITY